jgi:hypothetical protein
MSDKHNLPGNEEVALQDLARYINATLPRPDYSSGVLARIAVGKDDERSRSIPRTPLQPIFPPRLAAAVLVVIALVLAGVIADPSARRAIAGWFSFDGISIKRGSLAPSSHKPANSLGSDLGLGQSVSLSQARQSAGFQIGLPSALGTPAAIYEHRSEGAVVISVIYRPSRNVPVSQYSGVGLILTEIRSDGQVLLQKILGAGAGTSAVDVHGAPGVFISGPQEVLVLDPEQRVLETPARLSANTVIWQVGSVTYRLEVQLNKAHALALARSIQPGP